jgi:hypothetical protein
MDPLAVDLTLLLRTLESEVRLTPGRVLMGRVVDNGDPARAKLSIAGKLLEAQLPAHLQDGEEVRLTVREVSADRVVLSLSNPFSAEAPRHASERPDLADSDDAEGRADDGDGNAGHSVSLRYQAPTIGAVDVRLHMREGALHALVAVKAGQPHTLARSEATALRERLTAATGLPVELSVQARHDQLELYA